VVRIPCPSPTAALTSGFGSVCWEEGRVGSQKLKCDTAEEEKFMELWEEELSQYRERLERLKNWEPGVSELVGKLPHIPLDYSPSPEGIAAVQLSSFVVSGCLAPTGHTIAAFNIMWSTGLLTMISLPVRLTFEIWASAHYASHIIDDMEKTGDVERALKNAQRLLMGARSEVQLPWGGLTQERSVHIMDLIRDLRSGYPTALETYDFLCESCHPSHLMLTYWWLAGPPLQNWKNEKFRLHVHSLIRKTLDAMEQSIEGISFEARNVLQRAMPFIEKDQIA